MISKIEEGIATCVVIVVFVGVLICFYNLGSNDGEEVGQNEVRAEAVRAGVAEYYIDDKNEKAFRFKIEKGK